MAKATRTVTIANREGLHLRAATLFVGLAQNFDADIKIRKDNRVVDGKSTALHLTGLGAYEGDQLLLQAEGEDAEKALDALAALFTPNFGEDEGCEDAENRQEKIPEGVGEDESASA